MITLMRPQPRQRFRAGEQPEESEFGERASVYAGACRKDDPAQVALVQSSGLHLCTASGRHNLHPPQPVVRFDDAAQCPRIDVRYPVQHVG
jgi:hypothetical protein